MFCKNCGNEINDNAVICPKCGCQVKEMAVPAMPVQVVQEGSKTSDKSWFLTGVLCYFVGWLGAHRFYTGELATAFLWLFTGGLFGIGWFFDCVALLFNAYTVDGKKLAGYSGCLSFIVGVLMFSSVIFLIMVLLAAFPAQ